jgi:glycine betaine/proline transport system substrate-binding protein
VVHDGTSKRLLISRRSFLATSAAAVVTSTEFTQAGSQRPVILGQGYLSFYAVTGAVVQEMLERLGHSVEVREGPHETIFPLLGDGAIDLMAAVWLPEGHATYWAQYGRDAEEIAKFFDGAHFFWAVPEYVPRSEVSSIADLEKPAVAERMNKVIQGIGAGATITTLSQEAIGAYKLDGVGYSFHSGTPAEWIAAYEKAVADQKWIVFPTWAPQYLNRDGKLRPLEDPRGILGGTNHASLVGPRKRLQLLPAKTRTALSRIHIGIDGVTEMDWVVNVKKKTPREAARSWIEANEGEVRSWLGE